MIPGNATDANVTSYREMGWSKRFEIIWMTLPEATKALSILKHCSCKLGWKGRCICQKIEYLVTINSMFLFDILFITI